MFDSMVAAAGPDLDRHGCAAAIEQNQRLGVVQSCRQLYLAAQFADLYPAEGIVDRSVGGGETAWRPGGEGTPAVAGFCLAELAGALATTSGSAARLVGDALDLRHRLPLIWRRVLGAEIPAQLARKVAAATHRLSLEAAGMVDVELVDKIGTISYGRFLRCLEAAVLKADPDAAREEAEQAAKQRFVFLGRTSEHGLKWIIARCAAGDAIFLDAMVTRIADILGRRGDSDSLDVRRSKALGILAQPAEALRLLHDHRHDPDRDGEADEAGYTNDDDGLMDPSPEPVDGQSSEPDHQSVQIVPPPFDPARARPKVVIYVHLSAEALQAGSGVARMEGVGPVLLSQLRDVLGDFLDIKLAPVIDLNESPAPVDAYEIPDRLREHLILRNPADLFPYAGGMARGPNRTVDIDHTIPYVENGPPGQTYVEGLAPFARFHHRVKTHGHWRVRQPEPGTLIWRSPLGRIYLVNHSGTHALGHGPFAHAIWRAADKPDEESRMEVFFTRHLFTLAT